MGGSRKHCSMPDECAGYLCKAYMEGGLRCRSEVEVIELEPLLDLLEQAEATGQVTHVVHALLGQHGRGMSVRTRAEAEREFAACLEVILRYGAARP